MGLCLLLSNLALADPQATNSTNGVSAQRALLDQYCIACHNQAIVNSPAVDGESLLFTQLRGLGLTLDTENVDEVSENPEVWEKVVRKLRVGVMPPPDNPRPDNATYNQFRTWLERELDLAAQSNMNPGRTQAFHRLNQTEYRNAVRDLLGLDIDVSEMIPPDAPDQHGFDNNAEVLSLSPSLMERYVSAAHKLAELAVGATPRSTAIKTYEVPLNLMQDDRLSDELPFGSRGGTAIEHYFPVDGDYRIKVLLQTNYVDFVRGIDQAHEMEISKVNAWACITLVATLPVHQRHTAMLAIFVAVMTGKSGAWLLPKKVSKLKFRYRRGRKQLAQHFRERCGNRKEYYNHDCLVITWR